MKRSRFAVLPAVVLILVTMFPTATFAASIGGCVTNGNNNNKSGETYSPGQFYGVSASVQVPGSGYFGPCSPNDQLGQNISVAQIGISNGTAFVDIGIAICNWDNKADFPPAICNGGRHFYAEQHGAATWDYTMFTLGSADTSAHSLEIFYGLCQAGHYCFYVDGVLKLNLNMNGAITPTQSNLTASWQFETADDGDGLGTVTTATNIGQMESYFNGAWHWRDVGTACDVISAQHHCVVNGTHGEYAYTTN